MSLYFYKIRFLFSFSLGLNFKASLTLIKHIHNK